MYAFLVVAALFVATVLLWLSMRRHLGRIDVDGEADGRPDGSGEPGPAGPGEPDARS